MSASKAAANARVRELEKQLAESQRNVIFLLQAVVDFGNEHPEIEGPNLGDYRFSEQIWRHIT